MSIIEIYVGSKNFKKELTGSVPAIVYKFEDITLEEAERLCKELLTNPTTQEGTVEGQINDEKVEISYKPGVMNPVEESLLRGARNLGINPTAVGTSRVYFVDGNEKFLQVPLSQVEEVVKEKRETLILDTETPPVKVIKIDDLDEGGLAKLSKERSLFLDRYEMGAIQDHFRLLGRNPTDCEIEMLAQTLSEHNGHKTFRSKLETPEGIVKESAISRIKKTSEKYFEKAQVVTAFKDNSGGIYFYDGEVLIAKAETHNSPVAVEPVGGAETKVGGAYRDIVGTGKGGKNLFAIVVNCFGDPELPQSEVNEGCLHPRVHLEGNTKGESDYGNKMGIPTLGAIFHFHDDFAPKPMSLGVVVGMIKKEYSEKGHPEEGDLLITVGGRTGKDGIHGATFSSGEMTSETKTIHSTAVQMGNAIEQKRMFDALEKCRDVHLIRAITDCGGGGYSSAIGEIGEEIGVEVNLDLVPLKYKGLAPWEIWLSESQERMVVAIDPKDWDEFRRICEIYETPATKIGRFTGDKMLRLKYQDEIVGELSMEFLHNGIPKRRLEVRYKEKEEKNEVPYYPDDWSSVYRDVVGHLNINSKEPIFRRYDHSVGGRTVVQPLMGVNQDVQPDASVIAPIYGKPYGVVTACALNPNIMKIDPYEGTIWSFAEAAVKYVAAGGYIEGAAALDNYIWPSNTAYTLGALDKSVDALCLMLDTLEIPVVSGKDSLSGTFRKKDGTVIEIPYTVNITLFGKIPDVSYVVTPQFKNPGSAICLVGAEDFRRMGGSIYLDVCGKKNNNVPKVDLNSFPKVLKILHNAIRSGKIASCKAVGEGGMAAAISSMCFASGFGASINLGNLGTRADFAFFNETPSFLIEVESLSMLEMFREVPYKIIGNVIRKPLIEIKDETKVVGKVGLADLRKAWQWKY
ncbi:MAG TPA: AIR synthase-related protein [Patescibacteria group bacterium]